MARIVRSAALAVAAVMALTPQAVLAKDANAGRLTLGLRAHVPVICRLTFKSAPVLGEGAVSLGNVQEFCNNGAGYRVVATIANSAPGARLIVDGLPIELDGETVVVSESRGPGRRLRNIVYDPGGQPLGQASISLRIEAV